jgi:DNA polymerase III epsilon subunit-like protein
MDGLLTILDFETTSLENPFAIEIGMIAVDENLQEISRYESVIKPPIDVSKKILGMTRLTSVQLETAPIFEDIWPDIHKFLSNRIVVAHFAQFESKVLYKEFHRMGIEEYLPRTLCTRNLSKKAMPELKEFGLEYLTKHLGISHVESHQAIGDVIPTLELLKKIDDSGTFLKDEISRLRDSLVSIPTPQDLAKKPQVRIRSEAEEHSLEKIVKVVRDSGKKRISITGTPVMGKDVMAAEFLKVGLSYDKGPIVNAMAFVVLCANKPGESKVVAAKKMGIPVISEDLALEVINEMKNF